VAASLAFCAACGDDDGPAPEPDAGPPDAGPPEPDAGPMPDAGDIRCGADGIDRFRAFDRSCATAADCTAAMLQTDCCGSLLMTGINASEVDRFAAAAAECSAMYPDCDCTPMSTRADDYTNERTATGPVTVECMGSACRTTYP